MGERVRGYIAAAIGAFSVWWAAPLVKLAGVDALTAAWWRFVIGAWGALAAHRILCTGCEPDLRARGGWVAGVLLALHMILWFDSLREATTLASTAIVCTYPAFAAMADVVRGEIPWWKATGVTLALASAIMLTYTGAPARAVLEALASSIAAAAYFQALRLERIRGMSATGLALVAYTSASIVTSLAALASGVNPLSAPPSSIPYLVALGLVPMLVGHTLLNYALAYLPASIVTGLVVTEPPGASLLAYLLLGEKPSESQALYSTLALAATIIALLPQNATHRSPHAPSRPARRNARG